MSDHEGESGDAPDTFDDRLAVIARLIDTLDDEVDPDRRQRKQALVLFLLARLGIDASSRVVAELDRLELV